MIARRTIGWLLLVLLVVVSGGAATLGIAQAPTQAGLKAALSNTLGASNYTEVLTEVTPQGQQTEHLVYQAPDRLGGYVESSGRRSYVAIIGKNEYQTVSVASSAPTDHLVFYRQVSPTSAVGADPVHAYLSVAQSAKLVKQDGAVSNLSVSRAGQSASLAVTVAGSYVSEFQLTAASGHAQLDISEVGSSPSVQLPAGSKVVTSPPGSTGGATG